MDYSQYLKAILSQFVPIFIASILGIVASFYMVCHCIKLFKNENVRQGKFNFLFINNVRSLFDGIGVVLFGAVFILLDIWSIRIVLPDIPCLLKQDYKITTGIVVAQDASGREDVGEYRGVQLQCLDTGEIVSVNVFYTPIRKGEVYKVVYLPHTKAGVIVEKVKSNSA